ncbi:hypothetical protein ACSYAD_13805 [Acaryochloris marina NIES-2412]|uniref:hypothetical protein n=1 Tax=Acaryochloris marina TaxID=155978 RepID=UPI0040581782
MNHKQSFLKILTGIGLLSLTSCNSVSGKGSEHAFNQAIWPQHCQKLRQELSQQPGGKITYQPLPKDRASQPSWKLNWYGRQIPIPAIQYTDVLVIRDKDDSSVLLKGQIADQTASVVLSRSPKIEPMVDIFAEIADSGTAQNSSEGIALTQKLFGGPVSVEQLSDLGYRHTLADITCDKANWQEEVPIALALIIKDIAAPIGPSTSAYNLNPGILLASQSESKDKWWSKWHDEQYDVEVILTLPKDHQQGNLGFALGKADGPVAPNVPVWLGQLETAIANPTQQNWQALRIAFKQAKISDKSIQKIEELLEASQEG